MQELKNPANTEKLTPAQILALARKGELPVVFEETRLMSHVTLEDGQQLVLKLEGGSPDFGPDVTAATLIDGSRRYEFDANGITMLRYQFGERYEGDDGQGSDAGRWIRGLPFANYLAEGLFTFGTAPRPVQMAMLHRLAELNELPLTEEEVGAESTVDLERMIEQAYDAVSIGYALVPRDVVIEVITNSWSWQKRSAPEEGLTWERCHADYVRDKGIVDYSRINRWPVLIATELSEGDVIEDGWQRLHSYLNSGHETIPVAIVHHDESVLAGRALKELARQKWIG